MIGKVYFVATPIGNLADITLRALETLRSVDRIACEDTRHSAILLNKYDIHKPTFSYHKFNEHKAAEQIIKAVENGENIAVISDAGMPVISDPGAILIRELIEKDLPFEIIPGASAAIMALCLSGLDDGAFTFAGFLPEKKQERINYITRLARAETTLIFYSACHDLNKDLQDLFAVLGERKVAICNELTKKFEKVIRGNLGSIELENPKGEFVVVVEKAALQNSLNNLSLSEHIVYYLNTGVTKMEAIKLVAKDRGLSKSEVYKMQLTDKN